MLTSDLPLFVQPADSVLQSLLLLLGEDVSQFITCLQKHAQHPLIHLTKKILCRKKYIQIVKSASFSELLNIHKHNYTETHPPACTQEEDQQPCETTRLPSLMYLGSSSDLTLCFFSKSSASPVSFKQPRAFFSTLSSSCLDSSNLLLRQLLASSCLLHSPTSFSKAWEDGGSGN